MGIAKNESEMFSSALTKEELDARLCAKCGVFDIAHNDGYRKDPDVTKKPCKHFEKKEVEKSDERENKAS